MAALVAPPTDWPWGLNIHIEIASDVRGTVYARLGARGLGYCSMDPSVGGTGEIPAILTHSI